MSAVDPRPGFYYVSALDGDRSARVRGPFTTHPEALAAVDEARRKLIDLKPEAHWYAFGTCRTERDMGYLDSIE